MRLAGKVALVTGGGTGIGAATAQRFRAEGAEVVVMGRRAGPLDAVAEATGAVACVGDAAVADDARRAVELARERFGGLDVVVANAGSTARGAAADLSDADWAAAIHANLATAYVICREALPSLIERRGNVVIVSSLAACFAPPMLAGYVTTKHALTGLTRSIALDYGPRGVRVNSVNPAWTRTEMGDDSMALIGRMTGLDREAAYELVTRHVPLRRPAEAHEIASICLFLASDEAAMVTGAVILADGGAHVVDVPTIELGH